jgi:hypothetical protein
MTKDPDLPFPGARPAFDQHRPNNKTFLRYRFESTSSKAATVVVPVHLFAVCLSSIAAIATRLHTTKCLVTALTAVIAPQSRVGTTAKTATTAFTAIIPATSCRGCTSRQWIHPGAVVLGGRGWSSTSAATRGQRALLRFFNSSA